MADVRAAGVALQLSRSVSSDRHLEGSLGTLAEIVASTDPPKPDLRVIVAYLDDVDLELDAAKRLITEPPNRSAAFHLEQAAEKLVKAIRLGRGLRVTADHNIEALVEELRRQRPRTVKF